MALWQRLNARRLDLPLAGDGSGRYLPWIIAVMVYLSALGGLGLIVLSDTLSEWGRDLTATLTLQVPASSSAARLETVLGLLRATKAVTAVRLIEPAETARLLEPWLGNTVSIESLPLPRLIDLQVDPDARIDFALLRQRVASVVPGAQLEDHRLWLDRLRNFTVKLESVIAAIVVMIAAATVLTVVFAARTGLAIHHPIVEILHLLGARDQYIAGQFQHRALWLGLRGGAFGALAGAVTVLVLIPAAAGLQLPLRIAPHGIADVRLWLLLVLLPPAAGLVSMLTARLTVLRRLARMP
ncbi:MAG: cell division protein [Alphaproteobacteria bacterium]|nr:cell division protein [Alphaproteobacteria bacterium]